VNLGCREAGGLGTAASRLAVAVTLALTFIGAPSVAAGQGTLVEGRARIDGTSPDRIRVVLDYLVQVSEVQAAALQVPDGEEEATSIPVEGLAFRPSALEDVRVTVNGDPVQFVLESTSVGRLTGAVPLPPGTVGRVTVGVEYVVTSGVGGDDPYRIRIPVLAVGWPAADALPGIFTAEVLLAADLNVYEAFPSGLTRSDTAGSAGRFTLDLPATPALISMRATRGRVPLGGLVQILDGLVLLALVATAVIGFRYLRGTT
jgi:hypothetical protein